MTNTTHPWGFRPVGFLNGYEFSGATHLYAFSASDGTAAYMGDTVKIDTTNRSTALSDAWAPGIPLITVTGGSITTTPFRGAIVGFLPDPEFNMNPTKSLGTKYRIASTARYAFVADDYSMIFEAEESGTNSYVTAANNAINKLLDITAGAGNTLTGLSGYTLAGASTATTNKPFRVMKLTQRIDNANSTASDTTPYWHWDVMMANSDLATVLVGA